MTIVGTTTDGIIVVKDVEAQRKLFPHTGMKVFVLDTATTEVFNGHINRWLVIKQGERRIMSDDTQDKKSAPRARVSSVQEMRVMTVELRMPEGKSLVWRFEGAMMRTDARKLYDALCEGDQMLDPNHREPLGSGDGPYGVNLIGWDRYPNHFDAFGLIIDQRGWE